MYYLLCFDDFLLQPNTKSGYKDMKLYHANLLEYSCYDELSGIIDLYDTFYMESISVWKRVGEVGCIFFLRGGSFDTDFWDIDRYYYIVNMSHKGIKSDMYNFLAGVVVNILREKLIDKLI